MGAVQLTPGAIEIMIRKFANGNGGGGSELHPVLQVAELRAVNASNQKESSKRYRLVLSDGTHLQQGMLATKHNDLVAANKVQQSSIVQLTQFVCHIIQGRPIIIIVDLNILHKTHDLIGHPKVFALNRNAKADQTNPASTNPRHGNPQSSGVGLRASSATHGAAPLRSPKIERGLETHPYNNSSFSAHTNICNTVEFKRAVNQVKKELEAELETQKVEMKIQKAELLAHKAQMEAKMVVFKQQMIEMMMGRPGGSTSATSHNSDSN